MSSGLSRLKRRVTAYLFVASRVTAHLVCEGGLGEALYIWERSVLWPLKIKEEGHGLPVCSEQGHDYLLYKRGLGQSLYIWEGSFLWALKINERGHGLPVCSEQGHSSPGM